MSNEITKFLYSKMDKNNPKELIELTEDDFSLFSIKDMEIYLNENKILYKKENNKLVLHIKHNQHYIQKSFIEKYFAKEDMKTFRKNNNFKYNDGIQGPKRVRRLMCETYLYESPLLPPNHLEHYFSNLESEFSKNIEEFIYLIENEDNIEIIRDYFYNNLLKTYLRFYYRTSTFINNFLHDVSSLKVYLNDRFLDTLIHDKFSKDNFCILKNDKDNFVLADTFMVCNKIDKNNDLILLPISSKYYICFGFYKKDFLNLSNTEIEFINNFIFHNSSGSCICKDRDTLKNLSY